MEFQLNGEYIELIQLLKAAGFAESGAMAKIFVDEGAVVVNGNVEQRRRNKIRRGDVVEFEGNRVKVV